MAFYDHSRKVGNRSDVWKHFALLTAVDGLLAEPARSGPFRYRETHAGAGRFVLERIGEWRHGIGAILPLAGGLRDHPYFAIVGDSVRLGDVYLGSWCLVARHLEDRRVAFRMRLTDISTEVGNRVWHELQRRLLPPAIEFEQLDGYDDLRNRAGDDLTLIDPPFQPTQKDWLRCRKAAALLAGRGASFLLWYPVFGPGHPGRLAAAAGAPGFELLWGDAERSSRRRKGCGLVAGGGTAGALEAATAELGELAALLGGRLHVRRP